MWCIIRLWFECMAALGGETRGRRFILAWKVSDFLDRAEKLVKEQKINKILVNSINGQTRTSLLE